MTEEKSTQHLSVFLSYARADKAFATQLKQILEEKGIKVWVDESELKPVEKWQDEIQHAILAHDFFVYVASRSSTAPESFCHQEIEFAKHNNKVIIPINIDPSLKWLPNQISDINWINFSAISILNDDETISLNIRSDEFNRSLDILLTALETDLDWVKIFTRLLQKAWEWEEHEKNDSYLMVGDGLQSFLEAVARYSDTDPELTPLQQAFLSASQAYDKQQIIKRKRNKKRLRALLISVSVLIIVACVSAFVIFRQTVNRIAGEISTVSGPDIEKNLLLSLQALNMSDSSEVRAAVHETLSEYNYVAKILNVGYAPVIDLGEDVLIIGSCISEINFVSALLGCAESKLQLIDFETFDEIGSSILIPGGIIFISQDEIQNIIAVYMIENEDTLVYFFEKTNSGLEQINKLEINLYSITFGPTENQVMIGTVGRIEFIDYKSGMKWRDPLYLSGNDYVTSLVLDVKNDRLFSLDRMGILEWKLSEIINGIQPIPIAFTGFNHSLGVRTVDSQRKAILEDPQLKLISSYDNRWLASKGLDGVIIWETQSRQARHNLVTGDPFNAVNVQTGNVAFIPGTTYLVFIGAEETIIMFDYVSKETISAHLKPGVYDIKISHDARFFILTYRDGSIVIYDSWLSNKLLDNMLELDLPGRQFDFYLQGNQFLMTDGERIHYYDLDDVNLVNTFNINAQRVGLSPDRQQMAIANGGEILFFNTKTEELLFREKYIETGSVLRMFFSPDGKALYALSNLGLIIKINLFDGHIVWQYQHEVLSSTHLKKSVLSPDGDFLVLPIVYHREKQIGILYTSGEEPVPIIPNDLYRKDSGSGIFHTPSVSPNNRLIAMASESDIFIYDHESDEVKHILQRDERGLITAVAFLDDDKVILSFSSGEKLTSQVTGMDYYTQQKFEIFSIENSKKLGVIFQPHNEMVIAIQALSSNQFFSVAQNGELKIWDVSEARMQAAFCTITGRELTSEEWNEHIGKIIPYQKLCSEIHDLELFNDIDYFDPERAQFILGNPINKKASFYEDKVTEVKPSGRTIIDFEINNQFNEVSVEKPVLIQCRGGTNRNQYQNDYMIAWLISTDDLDYVSHIEADAFLEYGEGIFEEIDLVGITDSGNTQVWVAEKMMEFKPLTISQDNFKKLHLQTNSVEKEYFDEDLTMYVSVNLISASSHANPYFEDYDYPMHAIRMNIDNKSGYDIEFAVLTGIVYDQEGQEVDFLFGGVGYPNFLDGQSRIIVARSQSISGRCVDFRSPYEPFTIRYFLTIGNFEHNMFGRWEGVYQSE